MGSVPLRGWGQAQGAAVFTPCVAAGTRGSFSGYVQSMKMMPVLDRADRIL